MASEIDDMFMETHDTNDAKEDEDDTHATSDDSSKSDHQSYHQTKPTSFFNGTPNPKASKATKSDDLHASKAEASADLGLSHSHLPSRASHDAQEVGRRWPMGMIFVPSQGGLSHSSAEFTSDDECWAGTAVLLGALQRLDQQL